MQVLRTKVFDDWLLSLRDRQARAKIYQRIERLSDGNPGTTRSVGSGVVEMKIDFGPGYRVYYVQRGEILTVLLCRGDKSTQSNDISRAKMLAAQINEE